MTAHRILLADDDRAIRDSLTTAFELAGYAVVPCADGVSALAAFHGAPGGPVDLLVLDVMMPVVDGLAVCRVVRAEGDRTPILMLTARTETADRVAGLDAGADDYLPKPFDLDELLARVRALLRRAEPRDLRDLRVAPGAPVPVEEAAQRLTVGDITLDSAARRVWRAGREVQLTKTEFDLLELLMVNAGIVLEHHVIYDRIWGYDFGAESKNLAVFIGYLRRKLQAPGDSCIRSVRGVGYTLRVA